MGFYKSMVYHEHDPDGWNRRPHRQGFPPPAASDGEDNDIEDDDDDEENDSDIDSDESEDYIEEPDPEHEARMAALRAENARLIELQRQEQAELDRETRLRDQILEDVRQREAARNAMIEMRTILVRQAQQDVILAEMNARTEEIRQATRERQADHLLVTEELNQLRADRLAREQNDSNQGSSTQELSDQNPSSSSSSSSNKESESNMESSK